MNQKKQRTTRAQEAAGLRQRMMRRSCRAKAIASEDQQKTEKGQTWSGRDELMCRQELLLLLLLQRGLSCSRHE